MTFFDRSVVVIVPSLRCSPVIVPNLRSLPVSEASFTCLVVIAFFLRCFLPTVFFFRSLPVTDLSLMSWPEIVPFLTWAPVIIRAAVAEEDSATTRARIATAMAGVKRGEGIFMSP